MAEKKFLIENYGKKSTFASFLPGISGEKGIPIWCYYVNRGQCVVSFGVDNKDHSIMEFYPAHQAYQNVKTTGFRTFVKKDCEFPYKSRVMGTSEPLKPLKAPYMARNPVKWGFFRLKGQEIPLKI